MGKKREDVGLEETGHGGVEDGGQLAAVGGGEFESSGSLDGFYAHILGSSPQWLLAQTLVSQTAPC